MCYDINWDSMVQVEDPGNMLQWLEKTLLELELIGGKAIIFGHVPNIDECNRQFGRRLHAIYDRF